MNGCLLLLVVISLIVLGLGDSLLVTPSLCSLALFFFFFFSFFFFLMYFLTTLCFSCVF